LLGDRRRSFQPSWYESHPWVEYSVIMDSAYCHSFKETREYFKTIGEVILLTPRQNIAQRGHDESEESNNKGNFREILVLDCLAEMVPSEIVEEIKNSEYFSIVANETKDVSKQEQISFVLSFLHFEFAERLDAVGLTEKIVHLLERHGLDYKNNLIGQAYDGAAVMSGKHSGVQDRIKEKAKYAFYIHCSAHHLNLVLVDAIKAVPEAEEFFALLQSLYVFTSGSYVHPKWLAVQSEMHGSTRELQQLSDTRWACRFVALHNIMDRLPALKKILQEMAQERRGEKSSEARGLLAQIDQEFVVHLVMLLKLFGETKLLSDMLQSSTVDLSRAADLAEGLVHTLTDFRQESFFDNLWDEVLNICEQCNAATQSVAERQRKTSSRLQVFYELFRLCKIAVMLPVSSATCERSFSTLKLVNTYLRSTITDERLSNLGVLMLEDERLLNRKCECTLKFHAVKKSLYNKIDTYLHKKNNILHTK
uniref:HAT C-terminal dimerisation domain-containing protein n=1 Tax=Erpetoichthys calabaricus TaxID=27687 RepID=A0A8C4RMG3_ERPCA